MQGEEPRTDTGPESPATLSADRPILTKAEDRLGRSPFADRLAAAIAAWKEDDSLVIGLYGVWGSGKSSVKNLVLEVLSALGARAPEVLEFNPWQWRGHDEVSAAFFREVLRKLGRASDSEQKRKLAKAVRRYAKFLSIGGALFDGIRTSVGGVIGFLGLLALGLPWFLTNEAAAILGQVLGAAIVAVAAVLLWGEKILDRIAAWLEAQSEVGTQSLEEQKRSVATELRRYARPFLVVIDDVDRLSAGAIRAVFQLIKANADFPHFIYLVLFERSIVERALQDEVKEDGAKFLEKIVQVGFDLPLARKEDIEKMLFEALDVLLAKDLQHFDQTYWGNVYHGGLRQYFRNLRDVKRFLGTFSFHLGLLRSKGILEVNPIDLIALETLRLFEPSLHGELRAQKELLTGRASRELRNRADFHKQCLTILDSAPEIRRENLKDLMKELFPPVADAFGGLQHGSDFYGTWLRELRACSPEIFDRYFEYSLAPHDVSQAEIERLLALSSDGRALTAELKRLAADGRLMTALERWELKIPCIDPSHIADVLIAVFNIGDDLPERAPGFFGVPPHWVIMRFVTKLLLREGDAAKREQLLTRAIEEADSLGMPVIRVAWDSDPEDRKKHPDSLVIRKESLPAFHALCVEKIRKAAAEGQLHGQRDLAHLLYRWRDWTNPEEVRTWVGNQIASQVGAISFLRAFLRSGTAQGAGDKVARIHYYIKLSETENFADSEQLEKNVAGVSLVSLPERDRRAVEEFRRALERKRAGKTERDFPWPADE